MSKFQYTIKKAVRAAGVGLHSGASVAMTIKPADPGSGIVFVRTDLQPHVAIPARVENVVETRFATTIGRAGATVSTVEHLMATFAGLGIDNALVEIDGPEVPAMDGSAALFMTLLQRAGLRLQKYARPYIEILSPVEVSDGDRLVRLEPDDEFAVSFEIDFDHPLIAKQRYSGEVTPRTFEKHIGKARTFGFLKEVEFLTQNGLARGASLDNAIVIDENSVLNDGGLRFPDEFVRHKVLDLVGDLSLLGAPIRGKVHAVKSGHALHHLAAQELLARPYAWRLVEECPEWDAAALGGMREGRVAVAVSL